MPARPNAAGAEPLHVEVQRVIARPVAEVYRAWTTPELIAQWINPGNPDVRVSADVRVGGTLTIELEYQGSAWRLESTFLEVVTNRRLRFSWVTREVAAAVGSVVTVDFTDLGGRTALRLRHEAFPDERQRADHDAPGWQQIVEVFATAGGGFTPAAFAAASSAVVAAKRGDTLRVQARRVIARPAEAVFDAWLTVESMERWFCAGGTGARVSVDARVGGRFRVDMLSHKGRPYPHEGEYLEIDRPRRLSFTWISEACPAAVGSVVTVEFIAQGSATEVVLTHYGFASAQDALNHTNGWAEILEKLGKQSQEGGGR